LHLGKVVKRKINTIYERDKIAKSQFLLLSLAQFSYIISLQYIKFLSKMSYNVVKYALKISICMIFCLFCDIFISFATINIVEAGKRFTILALPVGPFDEKKNVLSKLLSYALEHIKIRRV
jgi:hypothetical protein